MTGTDDELIARIEALEPLKPSASTVAQQMLLQHPELRPEVEVMPLRSPCCGSRLMFTARWNRETCSWGQTDGFMCDECERTWDIDGEPVVWNR